MEDYSMPLPLPDLSGSAYPDEPCEGCPPEQGPLATLPSVSTNGSPDGSVRTIYDFGDDSDNGVTIFRIKGFEHKIDVPQFYDEAVFRCRNIDEQDGDARAKVIREMLVNRGYPEPTYFMCATVWATVAKIMEETAKKKLFVVQSSTAA